MSCLFMIVKCPVPSLAPFTFTVSVRVFFFLWFACVNAVCVCDVLNTFLQISNISVQLQDVILILVFLGI